MKKKKKAGRKPHKTAPKEFRQLRAQAVNTPLAEAKEAEELGVASPADRLIMSAASRASHLADPSDDALRELRKLVEHNDTVSSNKRRVSATIAVEMLQAMGWAGESRQSLNTLCRVKLGRRSYGTP